MPRVIQVVTGGSHVTLNNDPNECPYCFKTIVPTYVGSYYTETSAVPNMKGVKSLFVCANAQCKNVFLVDYTFDRSVGNQSHYVFAGYSQLPVKPAQSFPKAISDLSPQFIAIYNQAHTAEQHGLSQVTGLGYRKALEFLVKDYLISKQPAEEDAIKSAMLGSCIKDRIADTRIKEMAKRATWLGNDEAHYVRRWVDKDVQDMKTIIQLLVSMVEQEHLFDGYMASMPEPTR